MPAVSDSTRDGPSEDDLVAFAARLLSDVGPTALRDGDLLRQTIREARELWVRLYQVSVDGA